mgnify:CR=1 FL=1
MREPSVCAPSSLPPLPACATPPTFMGLTDWTDAAVAFGRMRHGDWPQWTAAIETLPGNPEATALVHEGVVCVPTGDAPADHIKSVLEVLMPWRKGPFAVGPVHIDSEWRSDLKWQRLHPYLPPLAGEQVLDVGGGNGYFGCRLLDAGAEAVIGLDPTLRFVAQYALIKRLAGGTRQWVLPLRLEEVPPARQGFGLVLSLGVLYHQRDPIAHLQALRAQARPTARIVVETLILPDHYDASLGPVLIPPGRYARMRNVHAIPTAATLLNWCREAGLRDAEVVDITPTTHAEQRTTEWMTGPSLTDFLAPGDPYRTEEGWPAPTRAIVVAFAG